MKPSPIQKALELPNGARFVRFALQVNPHTYAEQYRGEQPTLSKEEYNRALAERCEELEIGAVGITHHNNVDDIEDLRAALHEKGVSVFPGFEIASSEGVHVLCLYEPGTSCATLNLSGYSSISAGPCRHRHRSPCNQRLRRVAESALRPSQNQRMERREPTGDSNSRFGWGFTR